MRAKTPSARAAGPASLFFALSLAGCSAIVAGDLPPNVPCLIVDEIDPCPSVGPGYRCVASVCQPPDCQPDESCNARDDDCDGTIDEDLDDDMDGYSWCPTGPPPQDCDDSNPGVHPARGGETPLAEGCDGFDNDCNTATADGSSACDAARQVCSPLEGGCVDIHCGNRPSLCTADQFCDLTTAPASCRPRDTSCLNPENVCASGSRCNPSTGRCATPATDGTFCDFDAECVSNLCVALAAARIPSSVSAGHTGVCATTCCSDAGCGDNASCWASGSGSSVCLPNSVLEGGSFPAPTSGACGGNSTCSDECGAVLDSAFEVPGRVSLSCGFAGRSRSWCEVDTVDPRYDTCFDFDDPLCLGGGCAFQTCTSGFDCASNICLNDRCRDTCGQTEDCAGHARLDPGYCAFRSITEDSGVGIVPICYYAAGNEFGVDNAACLVDDDCRDRTCVDATGDPFPDDSTRPLHCADTCCSDVQCGAGEQCRPHFVRGAWEMHCLSRPSF